MEYRTVNFQPMRYWFSSTGNPVITDAQSRVLHPLLVTLPAFGRAHSFASHRYRERTSNIRKGQYPIGSSRDDSASHQRTRNSAMNSVKTTRRLATLGLVIAMSVVSMASMADVMVNAVNSKDHTTLVAAVKVAGLVETLKSPSPFTLFAPTNAAFAALPVGTGAG